MALARTLSIVIPVFAGLTLIAFNTALGIDTESGPIICTLFLLPLLIIGVNYSLYELNFSLTAIYNFGLLLLNDLLIRSVTSDLDSWILKSFWLVLGISVFLMIIKAFQLRKSGHLLGHCGLSRTVVVLLLAALTALIYRTWME